MATVSFGDTKVFVLSQWDSCAYFDAIAEGGLANLITPHWTANGYDKTGIFSDANYKNLFPAGCNVNILSIGYRMPFGFEFEHHSDSTRFYNIARIGYSLETAPTTRNQLENILLPLENYELNYPIYRSLGAMNGALPSKKYILHATFPNTQDDGYCPKIVMLNVPDAFIGKRFYVPLFMKVSTNYYPESII